VGHQGRGEGSRLPKLPELVIAGIETPEPHDRESDSNQDAASHVIAVIGKAKNLPLINA